MEKEKLAEIQQFGIVCSSDCRERRRGYLLKFSRLDLAHC
jgi:hypothetical protein